MGNQWLVAEDWPSQGIACRNVPRAACIPFALCALRPLVSNRSRPGTRRVLGLRPCPAPQRRLERMSWLSRLFGGRSDSELKPQRLDYLNEALALERSGDFDAAITSYRLGAGGGGA